MVEQTSSDPMSPTQRQAPSLSLSNLVMMMRLLRRRTKGMSRASQILYGTVAFALIASSSITLFGMNWWIHSFGDKSSAYIQILVPALAWAIITWIPVPLYRFKYPSENLLFFWPTTNHKRTEKEPLAVDNDLSVAGSPRSSASPGDGWCGVRWLILIGLFDCLTGAAAIFSVPHVPQFLQAILFSLRPALTWATMKVSDPRRATPLNAWLATTFVLVLFGMLAATIPGLNGSGNISIPWMAVFASSQIFSVFNNVVQGKFLTHYEDHVSWGTGKVSVLLGDVTLTAAFSVAMLPVDSIPWLGTSSSPAQTIDGTMDALHCMVECRHNFIYFLMYCLGMMGQRVTFTFLNHYSPTLGAFVAQICGPVNALLILAVPSIDTAPSSVAWYFQVLSLIMVLAASLVYSAYEEVVLLQSSTEDDALSHLKSDDETEFEDGASKVTTSIEGATDYVTIP